MLESSIYWIDQVNVNETLQGLETHLIFNLRVKREQLLLYVKRLESSYYIIYWGQ